MIGIWHQYQTVWRALDTLPTAFTAFALSAIVPMVVALFALHEVGHWIAAKTVGVSGRIVLFPRRHDMKLWWLAVLGVWMPDEAFERLHGNKRAFVALAGPAVDIALGLAGLFHAVALVPGPRWLGISVAAACGLAVLCTVVANLIPNRALSNDGWVALTGLRAGR